MTLRAEPQRARGISLLLNAEIQTPTDFELFHATIFEVMHTHMCTLYVGLFYDIQVSYIGLLWHMGWLRLVGSLKLQVSFAKEPYKRDDILQKRPIILRSLLIVATPYKAYTGLVMGLFSNSNTSRLGSFPRHDF